MLSACCGVWTNNQNVSNSANIYLFKDNNRNTGERAEKVTPFSSVSTVALEQVNNSWEKTNDEVATRELIANSSKKFCNNIIAKRMKKSCKAARFCDKQRYWPPFIKQTQCMNTVSYIPIVLWQDHLISKKKSISVILVIILNTTKAKYLLSFQKQHHTYGIMLYTMLCSRNVAW